MSPKAEFLVLLLIPALISLSVAQNLTEKSTWNTKIIGGERVTTFKFPYMVSIRRDSLSGHICGGSIIDQRVVLTAAHCFYDPNNVPTKDWWDFFVVGGSLLLSPLIGAVQVRIAESVHIHPGFSIDTLDNDIAVVIVDHPFDFSTKSVQPIPIQTHEVSSGTLCQTHGWGYYNLTLNSTLSRELRTVQLPIYDHWKCKRRYGSAGIYIDSSSICAGYEEGKFDSCNGDSGGPLVCEGLLTGIVSFGYKCAVPRFPGVYVKVAEHVSFIRFYQLKSNSHERPMGSTAASARHATSWTLLFAVVIVVSALLR